MKIARFLFRGIAASDTAEVAGGRERPANPDGIGPAEDRMEPFEIADLHKLKAKENLIPQAVIGAEIGSLLDGLGARIETGHDELDEYKGAGFVLEDIPFAVMRYEGHPVETSTIYLPRRFEDVARITETIALITSRLGIPLSAIVWQRRDNPEL